MADVSMYKELAKIKNIEVEFKHPPIGQENEQFGLMIASRDLPDFIEYDFRNYPRGADKAIDDGIILKLGELIENYAPNFNGYVSQNDIYRKQSKSDRGDYYGFPAIDVGEKRTFGGLMIREDFLDELNLPVPETIDEWEFALRELKTKKGVKAPFTGGTLARYMSAMHERDPKFYLAAAQHPVMNKGDEPRFMERQKEANAPFLSITATCKNPVQAVEWADYFYSPEGSILKNYGVLDLTYTLVDNVPRYTDLITANPDGLSESEAMAIHFRANYPSLGINLMDGTTVPDLSLPWVKAQHDALGIWSKYSDNAAKTLLPPITLSQDESSEYSTIMADVDTYCDETILKYIQGSEPLDTYDDFIEKLKSIGLLRAIEINQKALDRYNSH